MSKQIITKEEIENIVKKKKIKFVDPHGQARGTLIEDQMILYQHKNQFLKTLGFLCFKKRIDKLNDH